MKPGSIIMHPAPVNRGVEIADSLVQCKDQEFSSKWKTAFLSGWPF